DVPPELRQDPAWIRTGVEWRDGCRVPMPWSGTEPPFGFGGHTQPGRPTPPPWAGLAAGAQTGPRPPARPVYRAARQGRPTRAAPGEVEMLDRGKTVLAFRRGPITVVLNSGRRPVSLPAGKVLVNSGRLADGKLPPNTAVWVR